MYSHLLVATDGSELSEKALSEAAKLAKALKAKVTLLTAVWVPAPVVLDGADIGPSESAREQVAQDHANANLKSATLIMHEGGVDCRAVSALNKRPYKAILETAEAEVCDLIVMASHGRGGLKSLLLGSETQKVLAHSELPVLVHR